MHRGEKKSISLLIDELHRLFITEKTMDQKIINYVNTQVTTPMKCLNTSLSPSQLQMSLPGQTRSLGSHHSFVSSCGILPYVLWAIIWLKRQIQTPLLRHERRLLSHKIFYVIGGWILKNISTFPTSFNTMLYKHRITLIYFWYSSMQKEQLPHIMQKEALCWHSSLFDVFHM